MPHLPSTSQAASAAVRRSKLSKPQQAKLEKHASHHSEAHMDMMLDLMFKGASFADAHKMAMEKVGK
jgi:hypothetical protein